MQRMKPVRRDLEPDLLRTFVAISEEGSFRRGAARVGRSQSAISTQIQRLEQTIGEPLFIRQKPAIKLTRKGNALLVHAHRILRLQEEAFFDLTENPANEVLRFGIPDDYANGLLPRILAEFSAEQPMADISVVCATSARLEHLIHQNELDVAVSSRQGISAAGTFLKNEPIVWVSAPAHTPETRRTVPLAVFQEDCAIRHNAISGLDALGRDYRICFSSPNLAALSAVVEAGLAVAAMPVSSVPKSLRILDEDSALPEMPSIEIVSLKAADANSDLVARFQTCLRNIRWSP